MKASLFSGVLAVSSRRNLYYKKSTMYFIFTWDQSGYTAGPQCALMVTLRHLTMCACGYAEVPHHMRSSLRCGASQCALIVTLRCLTM